MKQAKAEALIFGRHASDLREFDAAFCALEVLVYACADKFGRGHPTTAGVERVLGELRSVHWDRPALP